MTSAFRWSVVFRVNIHQKDVTPVPVPDFRRIRVMHAADYQPTRLRLPRVMMHPVMACATDSNDIIGRVLPALAPQLPMMQMLTRARTHRGNHRLTRIPSPSVNRVHNLLRHTLTHAPSPRPAVEYIARTIALIVWYELISSLYDFTKSLA